MRVAPGYENKTIYQSQEIYGFMWRACEGMSCNYGKVPFIQILTCSKRVGSVLYLFDLLLQVNAATPSKGNCDTFWDMPLPCARELWEPVSDKEWLHRYTEDIEMRQARSSSGLTLGHLMSLRQYQVYAAPMTNCSRPDLGEELVEWCEHADDLSMLVWMALSVGGAGQAEMYVHRG
jgi:hypothetical protein